MSNFAQDITPKAKDMTEGWPDKTKVRFYEAVQFLCENPKSGRYYAEDKTRFYRDESEKPHILIFYRIDRRSSRVKVLAAGSMLQSEVPAFLSYSRQDREWFKKVRRAFRPLEDLGIRFWCDKEIGPGKHWPSIIQEKLSDARAALLLVSETFLRSEFIRKHELGKFLARAKSPTGEKFLLLWVPLASRNVIEVDDLGSLLLEYQALLDLEKPLNMMRREKVAKTLSKLCYKVHSIIYDEFHKSS